MKDKLQEIAEQFKTAVISGNYELVTFNNNTATIKVLDVVTDLWIGNGLNNFKIWLSPFDTQLFGDMLDFTHAEKMIGWSKVNEKINPVKKETIEKQIAELQAQLK